MNKIKKVYPDGYYEAKLSRAGKPVFIFSLIAAVFHLLLDDIAGNLFLPDVTMIRYAAYAVFAVIIITALINYLRQRNLRKMNAEMTEELRNYGIRIPCKITEIKKNGFLEEYVIYVTGEISYGKEITFSSCKFYKNPGDYLKVGDDATVYLHREQSELFHIEYPDTFPVDAARFYIY
ncbi:MAG: hypothetical protein IKM61_00935 [Eubacteriaceae bacterium]|nr:hypothetical protein [Eubacteriaceae bacterium]